MVGTGKKTQPLSRLPQEIFSGLQMLNNGIDPVVHRACSEPKWCEKHPFPFTAWHSGSAPLLAPSLLPQTYRERLGQQSGRRTTNYLTHWKGLRMGSTPHISEEPKHCPRLAWTKIPSPPPKPHSKNPPRAYNKRKSGEKSVMRFHSGLK